LTGSHSQDPIWHQPRIRGLELGGALRDATLQLLVELLEQPRLAIKLGEDPDLGAQHLGDDRHRNVVDRAHFIGAQAIDVGQMDGGNEDDRCLLKARVLADHGSQLEPVELRHADVHQDDGDILLEQLLERLPGRSGLDEILAQLAEDRLVAQELGRLVVDQQNIDLVIRCHRFSPLLERFPVPAEPKAAAGLLCRHVSLRRIGPDFAPKYSSSLSHFLRKPVSTLPENAQLTMQPHAQRR
jgi:hypothetical protein